MGERGRKKDCTMRGEGKRRRVDDQPTIDRRERRLPSTPSCRVDLVRRLFQEGKSEKKLFQEEADAYLEKSLFRQDGQHFLPERREPRRGGRGGEPAALCGVGLGVLGLTKRPP